MNPLVAPASIPRRQADEAGRLDFAALRSEGLAKVVDLAGLTWTDYNLHDPGVTLLEALCFALTELVYRSDASVPDLLRDDLGRLDLKRQGLMPARRILPCRCSTMADYRTWLLDRVPDLADAEVRAGPGGLLHLRVRLRSQAKEREEQQAKEEGEKQAEERKKHCVALVRRAYRLQRTLAEDLHDNITVVEERCCELVADIEIEGPRDPAAVLAEVYHRCAHFISAPVAFRRIGDLLLDGQPPDQAYAGPRTRVRPATEVDAEALESRPRHLHVGDLAIELRGIEGLRRVNSLSIRDRHEIERQVLRWRRPDWVLKLEVPTPGKVPVGVTLRRRGSPVTKVDPSAVYNEYADLEATERAITEREHRPTAEPEPAGQRRWPARHLSVQHHLPPAYGLGEPAPPPGTASARRRQIDQLGTYLALFDQVLAHLCEQWRHVRDLYLAEIPPGPTRALNRTHWWQMLDDEIVPGIGALYEKDTDALQREIYEARDDWVDRRHRVLDQMLALYGQTYSQNTLRQFLSAIIEEPVELEERLLSNKAEFLRLNLRRGADRAGGFDYGKAPDRSANCSGLERALPLLLGFGPDERCHVVEHVLLRPRSDAQAEPASQSQPRDTPDTQDSLALRVSVIFPKGTLLTSQPSFADFANETVQLNVPAHVLGQCLSLDPDQMKAFESVHATWLEKLRAYARDPSAQNAAPLNVASSALKALLDGHRSAGG